MKPLEFVVILLCVLLGLGRGADLAFATDAATGLCTAGAVWWRYLALGAVVLAAVLAGRSRPLPPEPLRSRRPAAGVLAFAGAVCMLAAGAAQFVFAAGTVSTFVRILLEVDLCRVAEQSRAQLAARGRLENACRRSAAGHSGQCAVLLERADALYGEQLQLAQGAAHSSGLAGAGGAVASGGAGAHAVPAPAGKRPHPARCGACSLLPVPVLGTAPGTSAVGSGLLAAALRRCCRSCFPVLRCAASAAWGLPALERETLEITDKNGCAPLV